MTDNMTTLRTLLRSGGRGRRADPPRPAARAGAGGLGLHGRGQEGSPALDGGPHNGRFAGPTEAAGSAFVSFAGTLEGILCVQHERQVSNDNTLCCKGSSLRIPAHPIGAATAITTPTSLRQGMGARISRRQACRLPRTRVPRPLHGRRHADREPQGAGRVIRFAHSDDRDRPRRPVDEWTGHAGRWILGRNGCGKSSQVRGMSVSIKG